jgi:hypothetical protein
MSTENAKGVVVYCAALGSGERTHKEGWKIDVVRDGHLYVYDTRNEVVATYAPGQWQSAVNLRL